MRAAVLELDGLVELNSTSLFDDRVDLHGGHDFLGEVVKIEDLLVLNSRHFLFVLSFVKKVI